MVTYMLLILSAMDPYSFGHSTLGENFRLVLIVFFSSFFIPAVSVLLMRAMGMVSTLQLKDKQERIGPYIITGVFYLWLFVNLRQNPNIPISFKVVMLGAVIGLFSAFIINLYSKISMHTTGVGGLVGIVLIAIFNFSGSQFWVEFFGQGMMISTVHLMMLALLLAGLVGSARLILKAHEPGDIYGGYIVGLIAQFISFGILT